jgi:PAS domain-containing protein
VIDSRGSGPLYPRLVKDECEPATAEAPRSSAPEAAASAARGAETTATPEALLGGALAGLELPLYIIGADGRLRYANPAFQALLGPGAILEAAPLATTLPPVAEIYERLRGGEPELRMEQSFVVHGRLRHFLGQHQRIMDSSGALGAVVGFYADVGEQRRAVRRAAQLEERFDDLARSVSDWVWATDANMNLTYASLSIAKVLGQRRHRAVAHPSAPNSRADAGAWLYRSCFG